MENLKKHGPYYILALALIHSLARSFIAAGGFQLSLLTLWIILPYLVNAFVISRFSKPLRPIGNSLASIFILVFTVFIYWDISSTSTAGLIFLFAPLYMLIFGPILIIIIVLIEKIFRRKK